MSLGFILILSLLVGILGAVITPPGFQKDREREARFSRMIEMRNDEKKSTIWCETDQCVNELKERGYIETKKAGPDQP